MRFADQDEDVFKLLFEKHYGWVYDKAYRMLRNHQDTEEVSHDVFMKIWQQMDRWKAIENKGGWLNVVAKNTIIDAIRKKKGMRESLINTYDESEIPLSGYRDRRATPDEQAESQEAQEALRQALQDVKNPNHRDAWILHHLKGCSIIEISHSKGCCVNTAKVWIFRCNEEIKKALKGRRGSD